MVPVRVFGIRCSDSCQFCLNPRTLPRNLRIFGEALAAFFKKFAVNSLLAGNFAPRPVRGRLLPQPADRDGSLGEPTEPYDIKRDKALDGLMSARS
jgi:hypothetical protein